MWEKISADRRAKKVVKTDVCAARNVLENVMTAALCGIFSYVLLSLSFSLIIALLEKGQICAIRKNYKTIQVLSKSFF